MSVVVRVENVSKKYHLGKIGTKTLRGDLQRWWAHRRGKEDPFAKVGQAHQPAGNDFWALRDVSFDIHGGEAVGIIGKNGAGKSTLLKILSRITLPTSGRVRIKGRVASLLEVGTGFSPDLTGRENIFLNGAILGMTKAEVRRKFDEIVAFSGVEQFIDTPVKRYSSGMYVRLAFAVAAHLESEILILDEVLAVGDAEFQQKCLGKMDDVAHKEGRTIIFVSHSMGAVQKLCQKGVMLEKGKVVEVGPIDRVINKYLETGEQAKAVFDFSSEVIQHHMGFAYRLQVEDSFGNLLSEIPVGRSWRVRIFFKINTKVEHFIIALGISTFAGINIRTSWSHPADLQPGDYEALFEEDVLKLAPGKYNFSFGLSSREKIVIQYLENTASTTISEVADKDLDGTILRTQGVGLLLNPLKITICQSQPVINY